MQKTIQFIQEYVTKNLVWQELTVLEWTKKNVILNKVHPKFSNVVNFLLLICKTYLYGIRCKKEDYNERKLYKFIENAKSYELYNAKATGKLRKYYEKWTSIKEGQNQGINEYETEYINEIEIDKLQSN